tara:strand:+ start:267 stop:650 length:384 start_codon:yes stop_codon:yes gene_type:complete
MRKRKIKVCFSYEFPVRKQLHPKNLDEIADLVSRLCRGLQSVEKMRDSSSIYLLYPDNIKGYFDVHMKDEFYEPLEYTADVFFESAGFPDYALTGFKTASRLLIKHDRKLVITFNGLLRQSKAIVPI